MKKLADLSADELRGIVAKPHKGLTVRDYVGIAGYMIVVACVYKLFISSFFQNASPEAWFTQGLLCTDAPLRCHACQGECLDRADAQKKLRFSKSFVLKLAARGWSTAGVVHGLQNRCGAGKSCPG